MKKIACTIILAFIALAAIVWSVSAKAFLAWFPGAFVAILCGVAIQRVNSVEEGR